MLKKWSGDMLADKRSYRESPALRIKIVTQMERKNARDFVLHASIKDPHTP
jgi:hypothetical protein